MSLQLVGYGGVLHDASATHPNGRIAVTVSVPANVLHELLVAVQEARLPQGLTAPVAMRVGSIDKMLQGGFTNIADILTEDAAYDVQVIDFLQSTGTPTAGAELAHYCPQLVAIDAALNGGP